MPYRGWDGELVKGRGEEVGIETNVNGLSSMVGTGHRTIETNVNGPSSMAGTGHRTMSCDLSDSQTLGVISQTQISLTLNCIYFLFFSRCFSGEMVARGCPNPEISQRLISPLNSVLFGHLQPPSPNSSPLPPSP